MNLPPYPQLAPGLILAVTGLLPAWGQSDTGSGPQVPCPDAGIPHYVAHYTADPVTLDGRPDEPFWRSAPRSTRFVDLISGEPTLLDTRAAVRWNEEHLLIAFWIEEPLVTATLTERDSPIYTNNDVEVFIAGADAYYEFEINAHNTVYEVFFIWENRYGPSGYDASFPWSRLRPFNGVGFRDHPRGLRLGAFDWDFPGLRTAVHIDGTLNDPSDRDRGWTVELAFPWKGMTELARADGRPLPPREGDVWRIDFSRFNQYKEAAPARDSGGWAWSPHFAWDSHIPECFPYIHFSTSEPPGSRPPEIAEE